MQENVRSKPICISAVACRIQLSAMPSSFGEKPDRQSPQTKNQIR